MGEAVNFRLQATNYLSYRKIRVFCYFQNAAKIRLQLYACENKRLLIDDQKPFIQTKTILN
jgi:hypothetical protein